MKEITVSVFAVLIAFFWLAVSFCEPDGDKDRLIEKYSNECDDNAIILASA